MSSCAMNEWLAAPKVEKEKPKSADDLDLEMATCEYDASRVCYAVMLYAMRRSHLLASQSSCAFTV